jgi:hypothetical protein
VARFYSKSTGGLYSTVIHGTIVPADGVEITEAQHQALMAAQRVGQVIQADANGNPVAVDPPPPTADQQAMLLKLQAQAALGTSDRVAIRCAKAGVPYPPEWQAYDETLRAVVAGTATGLPERPAYPAGS